MSHEQNTIYATKIKKTNDCKIRYGAQEARNF